MLKKILGVFLALTLLVPMAGAVQANSLADPFYGASHMLRNGGFDANGTGWTVAGGKFLTDNGDVYYAPEEKDAKVSQLITGLADNTVYECTFSMKSSLADAAYIGIVQKNYTEGTATDVAANSAGAPWASIVNYSFTYEGIYEDWTDFRFTFVVPTGGNAVEISFGANRSDEALGFDDISVVQAQNLINNSSLDEEIPKCINNGIGTTQLPCQWTAGWKDGFMIDGTGYNGTKGMSVLGSTYLEQYYYLPLQGGGIEYTVSFRYMVRRRNDTSSVDVVTANLANTKAYAQIAGTQETKNVGNHQAAEEGVWYRGTASYKLPTGESALAEDAVRLILRRNAATSDELLICYDDIRVEYAKGSTTWWNHNTSELDAFPSKDDGVTTLRVKRMQYNHGTSPVKATLIACIYKEENGEKCLVSFGTKSTDIAAGSRVLWDAFYVQMSVPEMEEGATYWGEAFVWDSLGGLKSLAEKSVLLQAASAE